MPIARVLQRAREVSPGHVGYWAAALVILIVGWTLYGATRQAQDAEQLINHTLEALQGIGRIDASMARAEAGQRGFMLAAEPRFTAERDRALAQLSLELSALRALTGDNSRQQARIEALDALVAQRVAIMRESVEVRALGAAPPGQRSGRGQAASERIYALTGELKREELRLLEARRADARKQFDEVWLILVAAGLVSALVMVPGYIGYILESRRRERAERQLRDLADSIPGATYQMRTSPDGRHRFEFLSPAVESLLDVSREAALRDFSVMWETVAEEDRPAMAETLTRAVRDLMPVQYDFRVKQDSGEVRWLRASASLRQEPDGSVLWNGYWSDITRQRQLEAELHDAREAADSANRAKSTFLATMSHEIRTPMNGVLGMLEILALGKLDGEQRTTLGIVRESGRSLLRIIDDILDFSKIEAGKLELRPEPASIPDLVARVCNIYTGNASSKGLLLKSYVDPRVSPAVIVDALRLQQILNNLVSNAIKFTSQGEVSIRVDLAERRAQADVLRFRVDDTGIGISDEERARLFTPFAQARNDTALRFGGTGLGLAICRRLAGLMGATIDIESAAGLGTSASMVITLPVADAPVPAAPDTERDAGGVAMRRVAPSLAHAAREGTLVLVVDDHPINRMVLVRQVNALGYAAQVAHDGVEAVEKWNAGTFGAVLTDCNMPGMNGYQLARHIRSCEEKNGHPRVPIIACTANALGGEAQNCYAAGMDDYLAKPIELGALARKLDQWLPISGAPRRSEASVLDPAVLELAAGGDGELEREILRRFRACSVEDARELESAVRAADLGEATHAAHRIKGASLAVGATALAGVCERIERAARAANHAAVAEEMRLFKEELARLEAHLAASEPAAR